MSKKGLLGGGSSRQATLNSLASSWLLKNTGVELLGEAMGKFLASRVDKMSPANFVDADFLSPGQ